MTTILFREGLTFMELLDAINNSADGAVAVTDASNTLLGLVTDGDIRRALLRGESVSSSADSAINFKPMTCNSKTTSDQRRETLIKLGVRHLPIVDDKNKYVTLIKKDTPCNADIPVLLMAGGRGQRLSPLTDNCPKPMLELGGKPLLENIVDHLRIEGFKRFYISVNYLREQIIEYFGDGSNFGIDIKYLHENEPLGTGGALGLINEKDFKSILVINGDVITDVNFSTICEYHREQKAIATTVVTETEHTVRFGVVETRGLKVVNIKEKPKYRYFVNVGCYIFNIEALKQFPKNSRIDVPDVLNKMANDDKHVTIYHSNHQWRDLGTHTDYNNLRKRYTR